MDHPLERELERLRHDLLHLGDLVESMVQEAMRALVESDLRLAERVIGGGASIDLRRRNLEDAGHRTLVRHQPTAGDLRLLVAILRMATDLERIGEAAIEIARTALELAAEPPLEPYIDLPKMAELARVQVRKSLAAFAARDVDGALAVCQGDDEIDGLYRQLFRILATYMIEAPGNVRRALHLLLVARSLERIADHATNLAENAIYVAEGLDIRHSTVRG